MSSWRGFAMQEKQQTIIKRMQTLFTPRVSSSCKVLLHIKGTMITDVLIHLLLFVIIV